MASEDEEFEFRLRAEREAQPQGRRSPVQMQEAGPPSPSAPFEAAASLGSGMVAGPVSGLAGIAGAVLPGPQGQGADWVQRTQQAMTFQPRTEGGKSLTDAVSYLPRKLSELTNVAGENVAEGSGSPALGAGVAAALNLFPAMVSRGTRSVVGTSLKNAAEQASKKAPINETLAKGQELGLKALPESTPGQWAMKVGGTDVVKARLKRANQEAIDDVARSEAGLGPKDPLFRENLEQARFAIEAPYREVASVSPAAASALEEMQKARVSKKAWYDRYKVSRHPDDKARAEQFGSEERTWTKVMDEEAEKTGKPDLVARFKEARLRSAKNRTVEEALNEGGGSVNARKWASLDKKTKGKYLTGPMKDVADWANAFPDTIGDASIRNVGGTHMEAAEVGAAALSGHMVAAAGIPLLRGAGRGIALSKMAQPGLQGQPGLGLRLSDLATRPAATGAAALAPSLGLRPPQEEY